MFRTHALLGQPLADFFLKVLLSSCLLLGLGPVTFDLNPTLPITLQSLFILFGAIAFGWRVGLVTVCIYLTAGSLGLPVFASNTSGWQVLLSARGGYFFGFAAAAIIVGILAEGCSPKIIWQSALLWIGGHIVILVFGLAWQLHLSGDSIVDISSLLRQVGIGTLVKSALGMLLITTLDRLLSGREAYYVRRK